MKFPATAWHGRCNASGTLLSMPLNWVFSEMANQGFIYVPQDFFDFDWLEKAHRCVLDEAHRLSRKAWADKQTKYKQKLQNSFTTSGGKDAFRAIKKESLPEVNVLFRKVKLNLMQQH